MLTFYGNWQLALIYYPQHICGRALRPRYYSGQRLSYNSLDLEINVLINDKIIIKPYNTADSFNFKYRVFLI